MGSGAGYTRTKPTNDGRRADDDAPFAPSQSHFPGAAATDARYSGQPRHARQARTPPVDVQLSVTTPANLTTGAQGLAVVTLRLVVHCSV